MSGRDVDEVFALVQLHADVDDAAQDAPAVVHVERNLLRELARLELLHAQDHVTRRVLDRRSRHVPESRYREASGIRLKASDQIMW